MKAEAIYPQSETLITGEKTASGTQVEADGRSLFVDNIRVYFTVLAVPQT